MPIYKNVNKNFFKKWSHEMAYILGFLFADGNIIHTKRNTWFWSLQITDKEILFRIREKINSSHKISAKKKIKNNKQLYRLQIGSKEMCNDLRTLGLSEQKTKSLAVPHIPRKYFSDFVRGYFDGDGNIWIGYMHKERKVQTMSCLTAFTSCSFKFLKQLHSELITFGLKKGSIFEPKPNCFRLQFSTLDSLKLYDFMYNHTSKSKKALYLERKRVVFQKFINMRL